MSDARRQVLGRDGCAEGVERSETEGVVPPPIPHHRLQPGDVVRWQSGQVVHRWRVHSVCIGALGQEDIIEMESITHTAGYGAEFDMPLQITAVPAVLVRGLEIEDVGERFGVPSGRRLAP